MRGKAADRNLLVRDNGGSKRLAGVKMHVLAIRLQVMRPSKPGGPWTKVGTWWLSVPGHGQGRGAGEGGAVTLATRTTGCIRSHPCAYSPSDGAGRAIRGAGSTRRGAGSTTGGAGSTRGGAGSTTGGAGSTRGGAGRTSGGSVPGCGGGATSGTGGGGQRGRGRGAGRLQGPPPPAPSRAAQELPWLPPGGAGGQQAGARPWRG